MEEKIDFSSVSAIISGEVIGDNSEVRQNFITYFNEQISKFIESMSNAYFNWKNFDFNIGTDEKKAYISALIYSAINAHIVSLKIFLSGYMIAAGNLQRQVIETLAIALLCSDSSLDIVDRYMNDKYSTNKAVRDVLRKFKKLNLNKDALQVLEHAYLFYHDYSHPSKLSLASLISFSEKGKLYLGASFDIGKINEYTKEINSRVSLANIFDNIVDGIRINVSKW